MRYEKLKNYTNSEFKRLIGIPHEIFSEMVEVLHESEAQKKRSGRPHTLCIEDQILLTLNYLRNYSTQFSLSAIYSISESNINRTIAKVENSLMKSRKFTLPKRDTASSDENFNWVMMDVTESPIERPKKTKKLVQWKKEKA